jgi:hypothetical protein
MEDFNELKSSMETVLAAPSEDSSFGILLGG